MLAHVQKFEKPFNALPELPIEIGNTWIYKNIVFTKPFISLLMISIIQSLQLCCSLQGTRAKHRLSQCSRRPQVVQQRPRARHAHELATAGGKVCMRMCSNTYLVLVTHYSRLWIRSSTQSSATPLIRKRRWRGTTMESHWLKSHME